MPDSEKKQRLLGAMEAAGYTYDDLESTDDWLRFYYDSGVMTMDGWQDVEDWLNGVVFDDPDISDEIERWLNGEVSA